MASWMRAATASSRVLLRASRTGLVLPRQVRLPSVRYASAEAAEQKIDDAAEFDRPIKKPEPKGKAAAIDEELPSFSTLKGKISYDVLKALTVSPMKLTHMSPVQAAVLPLLPDFVAPRNADATDEEPSTDTIPRDLLVKARTGTGKTIAFLVPVIEARLRAIEAHAKQAVKDAGLVSDKHLEGRAKRLFVHRNAGALIISPTRELAAQIAEEAVKLTSHNDLEVRLFVGGVGKRTQMRDWMRGRKDIVVGTPGRVRDLLENEPDVADSLSKAQVLVLDEADTLLEMGFREDIEAITQCLPPTSERQTFLFSATVSRQIQQVARATLAKNHQFINCVTDDSSPVHIHVPQYHTVLPRPSDQIPHILRLLAQDQMVNAGKSKTIVFLPTTKQTQLFATLLRELADGTLPAGGKTKIFEIHSKRTQEARTNTSETFRRDKSGASILVTSDVSARGIDYPGVSRVIQVGVPSTPEQYVHRVGRTGRGLDTTGRADLVLLPWEVGFVTWQLTDIPLKPLTTSELKNQILEHAQEYDPTARRAYAPIHERLEQRIEQFLPELDEEAIRETFMSALGYYVGRAGDLRVQKSVVIAGLKDWTVGAMGLPTPPYVSETFLEKVGAREQRGLQNKKRDSPRLHHWQGRGRVSTRDLPKERESKFGVKDLNRADYERQIGERPERGERPPRKFGDYDGGNDYGGEGRSSYGEKRDYGGERRSSYGEKRDYGEKRNDYGERRSYGEKRNDYGEKRNQRGRW